MREIGSNFWLNYDFNRSIINDTFDLKKINIVATDVAYLSSGRGAISFAIQDIDRYIEKKIAILPAFTCGTVIDPFLKAGYKLFFYDVDIELNIDIEKLDKLIYESNATIILIHRYFGFDNNTNLKDIIKKYRNKGVYFIEDRTQNLFSDISNLEVDYIVGSFRKWAAIPDGGFAAKMNGYFPCKEFNVDNELVNSKILAFKQKYNYMEKQLGEKDVFLHSYKFAENVLDNESSYYRMSSISISILNSLNIVEMKEKRQKNYSYVYYRLKKHKGIRIVPGMIKFGEVPLYIAIIVDNRDSFQMYLRENFIYAPVIWPKDKYLANLNFNVDYNYKHQICLPIDQRYSIEEMKRMCDVIDLFFEKESL